MSGAPATGQALRGVCHGCPREVDVKNPQNWGKGRAKRKLAVDWQELLCRNFGIVTFQFASGQSSTESMLQVVEIHQLPGLAENGAPNPKGSSYQALRREASLEGSPRSFNAHLSWHLVQPFCLMVRSNFFGAQHWQDQFPMLR